MEGTIGPVVWCLTLGQKLLTISLRVTDYTYVHTRYMKGTDRFSISQDPRCGRSQYSIRPHHRQWNVNGAT